MSSRQPSEGSRGLLLKSLTAKLRTAKLTFFAKGSGSCGRVSSRFEGCFNCPVVEGQQGREEAQEDLTSQALCRVGREGVCGVAQLH